MRKIIRTDIYIGTMKKFFATVMYCCLVAFPLMVSAQERKPNVIYILADDLGYGDVGYNGQELRTPMWPGTTVVRRCKPKKGRWVTVGPRS